MTEIIIRRNHGKTHSEARASAEHMASELREEFALNYSWDGDVLRFKRPGVSGTLSINDQDVALSIQLGFFLSALKPKIEREVHRFFEENFQA